jgi:hypothetical protein
MEACGGSQHWARELQYEQNLEERLVDLHARLHRGAYRASRAGKKPRTLCMTMAEAGLFTAASSTKSSAEFIALLRCETLTLWE